MNFTTQAAQDILGKLERDPAEVRHWRQLLILCFDQKSIETLQTLHRRDEALRAYQRALAFTPALLAADFNIGVLFQEQGRTDAAITAFEKVLAREPRHALAHKALGDTLLAARRIDDWLRVFARFEAACPDSLSLMVQALEVCDALPKTESGKVQRVRLRANA